MAGTREVSEQTSDSHRNTPTALSVQRVTHCYGDRRALDALSLDVQPGEIFGILGPNGSGKTTLFRLISTLAGIQSGDIFVYGASASKQKNQVRQKLGIVFQSPSLDGKLTVLENMQCQAALYGITGKDASKRIQECMAMMGIEDRKGDFCEKLSGGLKRRVELAKGMLHRPSLMLLDEPSTGLDPAARLDLWHALEDLRTRHTTTILMTTHLLEEADKCDRLAIVHQGKVVAIGSPDTLRREAGEGMLTIVARDPEQVAEAIRAKFPLEPTVVQQQVRIASQEATRWVSPIAELLGDKIDSLTVARPSLEDVFIAKTGHKFWEA